MANFCEKCGAEMSNKDEIVCPNCKGEPNKKGKVFWVRFAAWMSALVLIFGALLYFNFFSKEMKIVDIHIGDPLPEFSLNIYQIENGKFVQSTQTFNSKDHLGEVLVVNFWETTCGPCLEEMPHFNEVAQKYDITMVAIHGNTTDNVTNWIPAHKDLYNGKEKVGAWLYYDIIFLQDKIENNECKTFIACGGVAAYPITLIADRNGKVTFTYQGKLSKSLLEKEVQAALEIPYEEQTE